MKYEQTDSGAWWLAREFNKDPHEILLPHIQRLRSRQATRYENMKRLNLAFENGPRGADFGVGPDEQQIRDRSVSFNHARNGCETTQAKLLKSKILPTAMTEGVGPIGRQNARMAERAIQGELRKNNFDDLLEDVVMDGLVCGAGFVFVPHGQETLTVEWTPADDVVVDEAETRYRKPRSIYRRLFIDRYKLIAKYGVSGEVFYGSIENRVRKIRDARTGEQPWNTYDELRNQIEVWQAWHLSSGPEEDDGRYAVVIDGATLEWDDWERLRLPCAWFIPKKRRRTLHGMSMMNDFITVQEEHDKVTERIQKSNHLNGGSMLLVPREANVNVRELTNGQGRVVEYDAAAAGPGSIIELKPTLANPQVFEYRKGIISEMYEVAGVPQMAATGQLPAGMSGASGKAIESAEEESAERLFVPHAARDRFVIDVAWLVVEEAEAMVEQNADYSVVYRDEHGALGRVKWKDVLKHRDTFDLEIMPANALAKSPAARFAQLGELLKAGAITVEQFRKLFGLPDLEAENDVDLSDQEVIDRTLDTIVVEGKPLLPESFDYLALCLTRGRKYYNMCRNRGVPEDRLALLRDYLARAKQLDDEAKAKAAALAAQMQQQPQQPAMTNAGAMQQQAAAMPNGGQG